MRRPHTLPAFTEVERERVHTLLAGKVAFMMGRKMEEGDWVGAYCAAKGIPVRGWSNLDIDVTFGNLGVEQKMLSYRSAPNIVEACGRSLMHPSLTRSIRVPGTNTDPDEAMREVLGQYAELVATRRLRVQEESGQEPDMRTGWLLWQESLRQFMYFEEEMLAPDVGDYYAKWVDRPATGGRKASRNLWVYEKETGHKRYSVTTEAGAKIQPYFDVPPPNDPNLYVFTVIGEVIDGGRVRVWVSSATARELERLLGGLDAATLNEAILSAADRIRGEEEHALPRLAEARSLVIGQYAYEILADSFPGANDEQRMQLLAHYLDAIR